MKIKYSFIFFILSNIVQSSENCYPGKIGVVNQLDFDLQCVDGSAIKNNSRIMYFSVKRTDKFFSLSFNNFSKNINIDMDHFKEHLRLGYNILIYTFSFEDKLYFLDELAYWKWKDSNSDTYQALLSREKEVQSQLLAHMGKLKKD